MTGIAKGLSAIGLTPPAVEPSPGIALAIRLYSDFQQIVDFRMPGVAVLGLDERPPRGRGWGPSPSHLMGAALGACLGAALLARLRGEGADVRDMRTEVTGSFARDARGVRRLDRVAVRLSPIIEPGPAPTMPSAEWLIEQSVVAQSLGPSVRVELTITPEPATPRPEYEHIAGPPPRVSGGSLTHRGTVLTILGE
jgi:hypothetical protein